MIKILRVLVFLASAIGIGFATRATSRSIDGFVLGGRNVGPWMSAFAFGTSYFSAVIFVGYAGQFGWKYGLAATWIGVGNALLGSLLAWWVLGPKTRKATRELDAATMPEFFGKRFGSNALRIASAAIIFVFLVPYTASIYNGLSRLFGMAFGVPYEACVVIMAIATCAYVVLGGYTATVVNDFVQGLVMLFGIAAVIVGVLDGHGGIAQAVQSLAEVSDPSTSLVAPFASLFGPDLPNLLGVVVLTSLGTWGLPQMIQKFYAIKTDSAVQKGAIISTLFALVVAGGSYFLGGFGRLYGDQIERGANGSPVYDSIVPTMLSGLPDILIGLVIVLVLSASMSTLSSLVLTSSSTLTLDLIDRNLVDFKTPERKVACMRALLAVFVAVSAAIALVQHTSSVTFIAQLMSISWGALAGSFLGPFFWGLYAKRVSRAAAWTSFVVGVGLTVGNMILGSFGMPIFASAINCGAAAMVLSLISVPLVSRFTKPADPAAPAQNRQDAPAA